ncbi:MAG: L,D-transpeptidase family protein [Candidatus Andeanibacterium colombiense]|uniref:L,D-transpeptidase family protein n=1 Tax=Candidatus Andeanibacterium colombiense TaxID=3121345 RepID=A0AAJ5XCK0_9SPHN|nr:MAG: L,D-transpeptidase family protein [Sphingomonadaceae bacterium]
MPVAPEAVATMPQGPNVWLASDARQLLTLVRGIASEGLEPGDYDIPALSAALLGGEGPELDATADRVFGWLIEDLRDGRTPMEARKQWFVVDPDADALPTARVMADALAAHNVAGVVAKLAPTNPDYALLKDALAKTPATNKKRIAMIQANMDRWRWLAHDLGDQYLLTNVPEFQLRLTVNDKIIRTYKTIVGKPGKTATPQLAEIVEGVIFNPTWTVPQSIVKGEGLGAKVIGNPSWAKAAGYRGTKSANGTITVVQQPGPGNSLGMMKLDMPNEHAIFLHDTPSRGLFNSDMRALSHGCVRTERALELAITMSIIGKGADKDEAVAISNSGKYTRVGLKKTFPVYITYFTMGRDINGELRTYNDIYGRDAPVLASFDAPRVANRARKTSEKVIEIIDDLQNS